MGTHCYECEFRMGNFCFNPKKAKDGQLAVNIEDCHEHECEHSEYSE